MTIGEWLDARRPSPPPALRSRVAALLSDVLARDAEHAAAACLAAAERLLRALLAGDSTTRDSALDLLTADALVTYAFEAEADAPAGLSVRASEAMARIAAIGASASHPATA